MQIVFQWKIKYVLQSPGLEAYDVAKFIAM